MLCICETKVSVGVCWEGRRGCEAGGVGGMTGDQRLMLREGRKSGLGRGANSAVLKAQRRLQLYIVA